MTPLLRAGHYNGRMGSTATYDSVKGTFTLTKTDGKESWSGTFPLSQLQSWIGFYRQQQLRYPAHAETYGEDVTALEALEAELGKG